jgi:hypothetical protein
MEIKKVLMEGIIQDLINYLCDEKNISINESMSTVYNSIVYTKLYDEDTGLYRESSSYIYELLKDEIEDGCLNQKEI